jgi:putative flippase GtrA
MREFVRFSSVTFGSFLANIGLSTVSVWLGFTSQTEKLVSQLIVTIILVVITYVLHKMFSFRPGRDVEPAGTTAVAARDLGEDERPDA